MFFTRHRVLLDKITNICLPIFTLLGFLFTSLKLPQWGLIFSLISEIFWFYSSYWAWKEANQIGQLVTAVILSIIMLCGLVNYWLL